MAAQLQFAAAWVGFAKLTVTSLSMLLGRGRVSVHLQDHRTRRHLRLHHRMEYLEKHPSLKLDYHKGLTNVTGLDGYCDDDWGTSDSRRSINGNIFQYNGAPVPWKSKLQKSVALSTAEAEYYRQRSSIFVSC